MDIASVVFFILAALTIGSAIAVILFKNPIFSALCLAITMTGAAAIFFTLGASFVAGVQLIVYAGAVMVMFVMVVMLIDLKHEGPTFSRGAISTFLKVFSSCVLGGTVVVCSLFTVAGGTFAPQQLTGQQATRALAIELFTKYIFGFEAIGIVLLVVLIGAIALARARGGTHA